MKKKLAVLLCAVMMAGTMLTGCGEKEMVYAVEAGSAGEKVATEKEFKMHSVNSQADA